TIPKSAGSISAAEEGPNWGLQDGRNFAGSAGSERRPHDARAHHGGAAEPAGARSGAVFDIGGVLAARAAARGVTFRFAVADGLGGQARRHHRARCDRPDAGLWRAQIPQLRSWRAGDPWRIRRPNDFRAAAGGAGHATVLLRLGANGGADPVDANRLLDRAGG